MKESAMDIALQGDSEVILEMVMADSRSRMHGSLRKQATSTDASLYVVDGPNDVQVTFPAYSRFSVIFGQAEKPIIRLTMY